VKKLFRILVGLTPILVFAVWGYAHLEAYCVFYPGIDTRYAPGFSEQAFARLSPGMTTDMVEHTMGKPLFAATYRGGSSEWFYTDDGKCGWGDWAWLKRTVRFENGRVVELIHCVQED
jgi:outer membrane protein assembly factor BamE (lipoprotein component of BamABCDE complex)